MHLWVALLPVPSLSEDTSSFRIIQNKEETIRRVTNDSSLSYLFILGVHPATLKGVGNLAVQKGKWLVSVCPLSSFFERYVQLETISEQRRNNQKSDNWSLV